MLTKQDLEAIDKLIEKRTNPINKKIDQVEYVLRSELQTTEKNLRSELQTEVFSLKEDMRKSFKKVNRQLNKLYQGQEIIIKFANEELLKVAKRLDKIEDQLKLPPL